MSDPLGAKIAENREEVRHPRDATPERTRKFPLPASLGFAAAVAVPCLVASLALGLGTIYVPQWFEDPPPTAADAEPYGTAPPGTTSSRSWATTGSPTTSTTAGTPVGYVRYTGPQGLATVLPASFTVLGNDTGTVTAMNRLDPDVQVRFGGAPPENLAGLYETISEAARKSSSRNGYRQYALERTTHGGLDAVDWEFQYDPQAGTRRLRAHYWRTGGIEYVLLAEAPPNRWAEAERLLDTMIDHSHTP
jgi:hypothetical protein